MLVHLETKTISLLCACVLNTDETYRYAFALSVGQDIPADQQIQKFDRLNLVDELRPISDQNLVELVLHCS